MRRLLLHAAALLALGIAAGCGNDDGGTTDNDTGVVDDTGTADDTNVSDDTSVADTDEDTIDETDTSDEDVVTDTEVDTNEDTGTEDTATDVDEDTGPVPPFRSCDGLDAICASADCCEVLSVEGGTFPMGRSNDGTDAFIDGFPDEQPEHDVTISSFGLDRFEVTVARMRAFVEAYDGTPPAEGAGAHPLIDGTGWQSAWDAELPESRDALITQLADAELAPYCTWTSAPTGNESAAINCVSWYVAFAFCAWDGGRLPTEAEWEYAAAGGDENRLYPWGSDEPSDTLANFGGRDANLTIPVGSFPDGAGRYGHDDLAGSMWEWTYDAWGETWYATGGSGCVDCANTNDVEARSTYRGGAWTNGTSQMRAAIRNNFLRRNTNTNIGFRCARDE